MDHSFLNPQTFRVLAPETILLLVAMIVYVGGAFAPGRGVWTLIALIGLGAAAWTLHIQDDKLALLSGKAVSLTSGPLLLDTLAQSTRWLIVGIGIILTFASSKSVDSRFLTDYLGSLMILIAGLMLTALAGDLVTLFVGLELVSIPTYIMLFLGRRGDLAQESTTKYFYLSIFSSALLLYGMSFLYGIAGSTSFAQIQLVLTEMTADPSRLASFAPIALLLIIAGAGFKLTIVPFHFYAPDVYEGTSNTNAGLLAVAPKIAGLLVLVRIVSIAMPFSAETAWHVTMVLAIITMTVGNALALWQTNIRRLLAYSSIAHGGYLLIGISSGLAATNIFGPGVSGTGASLFYIWGYVFATAGCFCALAYLGRGDRQVDGVDELAGLGRTRPLIATALAVCLFSLAGLPPLAGFWGKLTLISSTLDLSIAEPARWWFKLLAVVAVLNAAIAAAYYLRVVGVMFFREPVNMPLAGGGTGAAIAAVASAVAVLAISFAPSKLMETSRIGVEAASARHTAISVQGNPVEISALP